MGEAIKYEELSINELLEVIKKEENELLSQNKTWFSPNHILELYLYEYYINRKEYDVPDLPVHKMYENLAKKYIQENNFIKAKEAIKKANEYNPTDIEILELQAYIFRELEDLDEFIAVTISMYPFCYTLRDIASFYRMAASYHIDKYQPDIAQVLLMYSNLFYKHKVADKDLEFLEKALNKETPKYSVEELKKLLKKQNYPLNAKEETLAIVYQVAKSEMDIGNEEYARMLLMFLYQQTQDDEIKDMLKKH